MLTITVTNRNGEQVDQFPLYGTWPNSDTFEDKTRGEGQSHVGNRWADERLAQRFIELLKADDIPEADIDPEGGILAKGRFGNQFGEADWANLDLSSVYLCSKILADNLTPSFPDIGIAIRALRKQIVAVISEKQRLMDINVNDRCVRVSAGSLKDRDRHTRKLNQVINGWKNFAERIAKKLGCGSTREDILVALGIEVNEWRLVIDGNLQPDLFYDLGAAEAVARSKSDWNLDVKIYRDSSYKRLEREAGGTHKDGISSMKLMSEFKPYKDRLNQPDLTK